MSQQTLLSLSWTWILLVSAEFYKSQELLTNLSSPYESQHDCKSLSKGFLMVVIYFHMVHGVKGMWWLEGHKVEVTFLLVLLYMRHFLGEKPWCKKSESEISWVWLPLVLSNGSAAIKCKFDAIFTFEICCNYAIGFILATWLLVTSCISTFNDQ